MRLYKNKYRSDTTRLRTWDYGSPGYYYVTVCTRGRSRFFGKVIPCDDMPFIGRYVHPTSCDDGTYSHTGTPHYASLYPDAPAGIIRSPGIVRSGAVVQLTAIGQIAFQYWLEIPSHFPFVSLDEFIIMPDHLHGILRFSKPRYLRRETNKFGPQSQNLGSVIRNYKAATKTYATSHQIEFGWHTRYHDEVIPSGRELDRIRAYILNNPARWLEAQQK